MKYLLDTNTCVYWLRSNESVRRRVESTDRGDLAISTIALAALHYGAESSDQPHANHQAIDDFASGLVVIGVDAGIARAFGDIKGQLRRNGTLIEDADILIAATARVFGLTLVSNNLARFNRVPDIAPESWG